MVEIEKIEKMIPVVLEALMIVNMVDFVEFGIQIVIEIVVEVVIILFVQVVVEVVQVVVEVFAEDRFDSVIMIPLLYF
jgi:hypothetical protein